MKKILSIVAVLCAMVFATSCGNDTATPTATVEKALKCIQEKDTKGYVALLDVDESSKGFLEQIAEKAFKAADEKGGLKSYKVTSEEIAEDGQTATVKAELVYGSKEEPTEQSYNLVLKDGSWKIKN